MAFNLRSRCIPFYCIIARSGTLCAHANPVGRAGNAVPITAAPTASASSPAKLTDPGSIKACCSTHTRTR